MALTADELVRAKAALVPLMVPVLRRIRALGGTTIDPVAQMKSRYQNLAGGGGGAGMPVKVTLMADLGFGNDINAITLDPGDFNACVDTAALQL